MASSQLDWPRGIERTPPGEREPTNKFDTTFRETESDLRDQMRLLDVDDWRLEHVTGGGQSEPGVALYWTDGGEDRAVGMDAYTTKKDNLRELMLWVKEMRMSDDRPVKTGHDIFATAALPPGDEEAVAAPPAREDDVLDGVEPHEVLGVPPDAEAAEVRAARRDAIIDWHPDQNEDGSAAEVDRIRAAAEAMLDG